MKVEKKNPENMWQPEMLKHNKENIAYIQIEVPQERMLETLACPKIKADPKII